MEEANTADSGSVAVLMYDKSSPSKTELKSSMTGPYYNSMDVSNHNFMKHNCSEKTGENIEKNNRKLSSACEIKTFKKRFLMLFLASFCSMMNGIPQFQYTVVADIISCFYGVTLTEVNWTCVVYMAAFLPLVFPVMYLMDKKGLRYTVLIGGFLNCIGKF